MTVDLTQPEFIALKQILENKVTGLLTELAHTDDRTYREYVRETLKAVEQIQAKLDASLTRDVQPYA